MVSCDRAGLWYNQGKKLVQKSVVQLDFVYIGSSFTTLRQECAFQVNVCSRFILNLQLNPIIDQTLIKTVEETSFYALLRESIGQSNY